MSFRSGYTRFMNQDHGNQALSSVAILAVGAIVLSGVVRIGSSLVEQTQDRTITLLNGGDVTQDPLASSSSSRSNQQSSHIGTSSQHQGALPADEDRLDIDDEQSSSIVSGVTASQSARALQRIMGADTLAPPNGTFVTTPVDPKVDPPGKPRRVQQPVEPVIPADPTDPAAETPRGEDPGMKQRVVPAHQKSPARTVKRKSRNGEDPNEDENTEEAESEDKEKEQSRRSRNEVVSGTGSGSDSGFLGGPSGGFGGFNSSGFPGNNSLMGNPQNGFPQGMPNSYPGNFNGYGSGGSALSQPNDSISSYANDSLFGRRSARNDFDKESPEPELVENSDPEANGTTRSKQQSRVKKPDLRQPVSDGVVPDKNGSNFMNRIMRLEGSVSADRSKAMADEAEFTTSGTIEVTGVDRSDAALPRLRIVCHKPFRQIQVRCNEQHLAFNAPQPEQPRSIPLDAEMLEPGTELQIFGIESESAELLTYRVPVVESEGTDTLPYVPGAEEFEPSESPKSRLRPLVDPEFTTSVELAEQ